MRMENCISQHLSHPILPQALLSIRSSPSLGYYAAVTEWLKSSPNSAAAKLWTSREPHHLLSPPKHLAPHRPLSNVISGPRAAINNQVSVQTQKLHCVNINNLPPNISED